MQLTSTDVDILKILVGQDEKLSLSPDVKLDTHMIFGQAMDNIKVYFKWDRPNVESLGMVGMRGIKQMQPINIMYDQAEIGVLGLADAFCTK